MTDRITMLCVTSAIALGSLFTAESLAAPAATPTTTTSRSATQPAPSKPNPQFVAQRLLSGLESYLAKKSPLTPLLPLVSDQALATALSMYGKKIADLSESERQAARTDVLRTWAAVINFYAGYIQYEPAKIHVLATTGPDASPTAHVVFPASRPDYPRPIKILVATVEENGAWKVKFATFLPPK